MRDELNKAARLMEEAKALGCTMDAEAFGLWAWEKAVTLYIETLAPEAQERARREFARFSPGLGMGVSASELILADALTRVERLASARLPARKGSARSKWPRALSSEKRDG